MQSPSSSKALVSTHRPKQYDTVFLADSSKKMNLTRLSSNQKDSSSVTHDPRNVANSVSKRLEKHRNGPNVSIKNISKKLGIFFWTIAVGEGGRGNSGFPVEEGRRSRWKTVGFQRAGGDLIEVNDNCLSFTSVPEGQQPMSSDRPQVDKAIRKREIPRKGFSYF